MTYQQILLVLAIVVPILSLCGTLVGIIWKQHNTRLSILDRRVDNNLVALQTDIRSIESQVVGGLKEVTQSQAKIFTQIEGLRADIAEKYVSKHDCEHRHDND